MAFNPEPFDIVPKLRAEANLIAKMAEQKRVTLKTELPEEAVVTGDKNMLATVVRNILTNAVKFTPAGGEVSLSALLTPENLSNAVLAAQKTMIIAIKDNGVGMTAEQIDSLFRIDSHNSRQGTAGEQGTGLGLIVCNELLERHGSTLHIESEVGKGSRFWFEI
jgi:signal transduction histidine kinase